MDVHGNEQKVAPGQSDTIGRTPVVMTQSNNVIDYAVKDSQGTDRHYLTV